MSPLSHAQDTPSPPWHKRTHRAGGGFRAHGAEGPRRIPVIAPPRWQARPEGPSAPGPNGARRSHRVQPRTIGPAHDAILVDAMLSFDRGKNAANPLLVSNLAHLPPLRRPGENQQPEHLRPPQRSDTLTLPTSSHLLLSICPDPLVGAVVVGGTHPGMDGQDGAAPAPTDGAEGPERSMLSVVPSRHHPPGGGWRARARRPPYNHSPE